MDPLTSKVFVGALNAMMNADPWHEEVPLDEKLKKAWKVSREACEFTQKKVRAMRNNRPE